MCSVEMHKRGNLSWDQLVYPFAFYGGEIQRNPLKGDFFYGNFIKNGFEMLKDQLKKFKQFIFI